MDIFLDFGKGKVNGENALRLKALQDMDELVLDARDLDIHSVAMLGETEIPLPYEYREDAAKLVIRFPERVQGGRTFSVRTRVSCVPSDRILEGIYKDTTPPGCPQQYMSQCQQWGFQRILPVIDDCRAKCTMTTTLEADARYTHMITNGDVCRDSNPGGVPVPAGDPSRRRITYVNNIPMAPYLFIACVGTWDTLEDEVTYPSGRRVRLEYLVPPGRAAGAELPMKILKQGVLWQGRTQDYEYEHEVYRTICMERSNWGGMENVGNTTIITSAALVDEFTHDARLEYAYGVIVHEFEHNQCGSDVTMETPFDMWLNEAYTVNVERQFTASQLDSDCARLDEVNAMRAPVSGPLAVEDAGHLGNIVREGFNDPDELVDSVTYVKAAEVMRMLRLILGEDTFRKARRRYFSRYKGGNANTDDFFACFEEASGRDLSQFRREWLHTIGYPKIEATHSYDDETRTLVVDLRQDRSGRGGLFHVPVEMAAVDGTGHDIADTARVVEMQDTGDGRGGAAHVRVAFHDIQRPAFLSLNRDCSFYGTFTDVSTTGDELVKQTRLDPCLFNRVEAMRRLTDLERVKLVRDAGAPISDAWLDIVGEIIADQSLAPGLKTHLLSIGEETMDRAYLPWYRERYRARIALLRAVGQRYMPELVALFRGVDTYTKGDEPKDGIHERRLKAILLRMIIEADTPAEHALAEDHFRAAWNITDRISALGCINLSSSPARDGLLAEAYGMWKDSIAAYSGYLAVIASRTRDDVFDAIEREEGRDTFDVCHPGHSRSLYLPMARNNKMLWTDRGIGFVADKVVLLASVSEYAATRLLTCFQHVHQLADDLRPKVIAALERMRDSVKEADVPSVHGRIEAYLHAPHMSH